MEQYESELADALKRLAEMGRDKDEFLFEMAFLPPDPDGAGMFTVEYEVKITHQSTLKSLTETGGIGWKWVDRFEDELGKGYFD